MYKLVGHNSSSINRATRFARMMYHGIFSYGGSNGVTAIFAT